MKHDLSVALIGFDGTSIRESADTDVAASLKNTLITACLNADPKTYTTGEEKFKVYRLLQTVQAADPEAELSADDVVTLKKLVGYCYPVAVVGAVFTALENPKRKLQAIPDTRDE